MYYSKGNLISNTVIHVRYANVRLDYINKDIFYIHVHEQKEYSL